MAKTIERKSPAMVQTEEQKTTVRKAGIKRVKATAKNLNRKRMTVPVGKSFEKVIEMNEKALKIIAKRT